MRAKQTWLVFESCTVAPFKRQRMPSYGNKNKNK